MYLFSPHFCFFSFALLLIYSYCSFLPSVFAAIAVVIGTAGNMYCQTLSFTPNAGDTVYVGVFQYKTKSLVEWHGNTYVYNHCESYESLKNNFSFDYTVDKKWKVTKAFSIITPILGGIFLVICRLFACYWLSPSIWKLTGIVFLLCSLFQGLTLLVIQSDVCKDNPAINFINSTSTALGRQYPSECAWDVGFKLSIAAVPLWFVAGLAILVMPYPQRFPQDPPQTQEVTYQRTVNPDGTATVQEVAIVKGTTVDMKEQAIEDGNSAKV